METRVKSYYQPGHVPTEVAKWEKWTNEAPTDTAALIQITYHLALQVRTVKLILAWTLTVLPILVTLGFIIVNKVVVDHSQPSL